MKRAENKFAFEWIYSIVNVEDISKHQRTVVVSRYSSANRLLILYIQKKDLSLS